MLRWTKRDCLKAIIELRSPMEGRQTGQKELSPMIQKMREVKPTGLPIRQNTNTIKR